jgi:hypothetical protein
VCDAVKTPHGQHETLLVSSVYVWQVFVDRSIATYVPVLCLSDHGATRVTILTLHCLHSITMKIYSIDNIVIPEM